MAQWRLKSTRKSTGALNKRSGKKTRMQRGREFAETRVGQKRVKFARRRGGALGSILLSSDKANILDPKTGKTKPAKILLVSSNMANPHYTRRNILTKGAVIKTELGLARVTNRPSREGIVNAVLEAKQI
jgi:small subunit ribosomal protein S8e